MRLFPLLLVAATMAGACGGSGPATATTPAASASPSAEAQASASPSLPPLPLEGAYGVLVTPTSAATYTVSLIDAAGKLAKSAQATSPAAVTCGDGAAPVLPAPVSTSNSRVYFMDAQGVVRFLAPSGATGRATTVPVGSQRRSMFTVSPDDKRIAVVVSDFTSTGAAISLYVEDLTGGAHHLVIFTQTGAFGLWPTGWHGSNLVVAKVPACSQGSGPACCGPQELHVVDPATGVRKYTVGGPPCLIAGPPSPAGAICETDVQANALDWTGTTTRSFPIQGQTPAYLSPNGNEAALVEATDTVLEGFQRTFSGLQACGWIDGTRLLAGGDALKQPRVGDIRTGVVVAVPAQGACAGRIPGAL